MLKLFDTLSAKKRPFRPLKGNTVRIYTCGPSVYNYSHIGNFRTYLFEDLLVRYLIYKGYSVKRVMNITDIEDKAIDAAREEGLSLDALEKSKIKSFFSDFDSLGMRRPDIIAKASEHVPQMVTLIKKICSKGFCKEERDGIYFEVRKFRDYGALRHLSEPRYFGISENEDYSKEGLWDFRLWKRWAKGDGDIRYASPFGDGRPGWHIECSAMAMHHLGESFDIHCGGSDNIFPHHENEIAQSEAASGKRLANFWLHASHLTVGKLKMSKRTDNVLYVSQLRKVGVPPKCLRYYLISERYRSKLDFTISAFKARLCDCESVRKTIKKLHSLRSDGEDHRGRKIASELISGFESAMDDDLNTRLAFKRIFRMDDRINRLLDSKKLSTKDAKAILAAFERIDLVLGVF